MVGGRGDSYSAAQINDSPLMTCRRRKGYGKDALRAQFERLADLPTIAGSFVMPSGLRLSCGTSGPD